MIFLCLSTNGYVLKLKPYKNFVRIKAFDSATAYLVRGSLLQVQNFMMPPYLKHVFGKASRSTLVNVNAIEGFKGEEIVTAHGNIPSTKLYIKDLCK